MKETKSPTKEELLEICIKKKSDGASFLEIANIFKINEASDNTMRFILNKLDHLDQQQKIHQTKAKRKKKSGLINILIGIAVAIFAFILYEQTLTEVFIFGHIAWAVGGFLIIRGLASLSSGILNRKKISF